MTLKWSENIHGNGITFKSNGEGANSNGKEGIAFIDCLINRKKLKAMYFHLNMNFVNFMGHLLWIGSGIDD